MNNLSFITLLRKGKVYKFAYRDNLNGILSMDDMISEPGVVVIFCSSYEEAKELMETLKNKS